MILMFRLMPMAGIITIAKSPAFTLLFAYLKALGLPKPMHTLNIHSPAFLTQ